MQKVKRDENGIRLCDHFECNQVAKYHYIWNTAMAGCEEHAMQAMWVANSMNFIVPSTTFRELTDEEKYGTG